MRRYLRDPTFSRFDTIPECDRHTHTHTQTDTRRRHIPRLARRRAVIKRLRMRLCEIAHTQWRSCELFGTARYLILHRPRFQPTTFWVAREYSTVTPHDGPQYNITNVYEAALSLTAVGRFITAIITVVTAITEIVCSVDTAACVVTFELVFSACYTVVTNIFTIQISLYLHQYSCT